MLARVSAPRSTRTSSAPSPSRAGRPCCGRAGQRRSKSPNARELLVADRLRDGCPMRLSPVALSKDQAYAPGSPTRSACVNGRRCGRGASGCSTSCSAPSAGCARRIRAAQRPRQSTRAEQLAERAQLPRCRGHVHVHQLPDEVVRAVAPFVIDEEKSHRPSMYDMAIFLRWPSHSVAQRAPGEPSASCCSRFR